MKRRFADRLDWQRVTERRFSAQRVDTPDFAGWLSCLRLDRVTEPLLVHFRGRELCVAGSGFTWLQHFPDGEPFTLLTAFDPAGAIVQWYIDVCKQHGIDERGIPWFDDLYLDIVGTPSGEVELLDRDDLDRALRLRHISPGDYAMALGEAQHLMNLIDRGQMRLLDLAPHHLLTYFGVNVPAT